MSKCELQSFMAPCVSAAEAAEAGKTAQPGQHAAHLLSDCSGHVSVLQELKQLRKRHGLGSVQLRLTFKRGLHPFYPPLVELLRPRLIGPIPGALSSHPVAQLGKWDPWRTMRALAAQVKMFLQVGNPSTKLLPHRHRLHVQCIAAVSGKRTAKPQLASVSATSSASCTHEDMPECAPFPRKVYEACHSGCASWMRTAHSMLPQDAW